MELLRAYEIMSVTDRNRGIGLQWGEDGHIRFHIVKNCAFQAAVKELHDLLETAAFIFSAPQFFKPPWSANLI